MEKYIIKYNYNGQEYEDYLDLNAFNLDIPEIAYEALRGSLRKNHIEIKTGCLRNIELFKKDDEKPIFSAITYDKNRGFILKQGVIF